MKGKLYGIGIGPGDPRLLSARAAAILAKPALKAGGVVAEVARHQLRPARFQKGDVARRTHQRPHRVIARGSAHGAPEVFEQAFVDRVGRGLVERHDEHTAITQLLPHCTRGGHLSPSTT